MCQLNFLFSIWDQTLFLLAADICVSRNPSISCREIVVLYLLNPKVYIVSAINSTQHLRFYFNPRITQGVEIVWNQTADISLSASCHLFGYQSCHQLVPTGWGRDRVRLLCQLVPLTCPQCKWTPCWQSTCVWQTDVWVPGSPEEWDAVSLCSFYL